MQKMNIGNFIKGLVIVFLIQYFSFYILKFFKIPFPAPILGIIILFSLLKLKIVNETLVEDFCNFILKYMILFFIPLFVGIICYFDIIAKNFWAILLTIFITTTMVMVIVGLFVENMTKLIRLAKFKKGKKQC